MLINSKTRKEVKLGDTAVTFRGEEVKITAFRPPHKINSSGHVTVKFVGKRWEQEFYPSVIDCEYVNTDQQQLNSLLNNLLSK